MSENPPERGQTLLLEGGVVSSSHPLIRAAPANREEFVAGFDRCFDRVYTYVGRHVSDRASCERIVSEVLAENLELLVERRDEQHEFMRLKASSGRLIGLELALPSHEPPKEPGSGPSARVGSMTAPMSRRASPS